SGALAIRVGERRRRAGPFLELARRGIAAQRQRRRREGGVGNALAEGGEGPNAQRRACWGLPVWRHRFERRHRDDGPLLRKAGGELFDRLRRRRQRRREPLRGDRRTPPWHATRDAASWGEPARRSRTHDRLPRRADRRRGNPSYLASFAAGT